MDCGGYPRGVVQQGLEDAGTLSDDACSGGYRWARHVVDIVVVRVR
jgi:hypothetical protein